MQAITYIKKQVKKNMKSEFNLFSTYYYKTIILLFRTISLKAIMTTLPVGCLKSPGL